MQAGTDSRSVQELLIYAEVATTMIKTHVLQMDGGAQSAGLVVQHLGAAKQSLVNFCTQPETVGRPGASKVGAWPIANVQPFRSTDQLWPVSP